MSGSSTNLSPALGASTRLGVPLLPASERLNSRLGLIRLWLAMIFFDHGLFRIFFNRMHEVTPGVYRSSHPLPFQIRKAARLGVKTIINLRGLPHSEGSYALERRACDHSGITLRQLRLRSRDVPRPEEIEALSQLFDEIEYPVLMHCKSGADRVGLASALYLIMKAGASTGAAQRQLSLRFGHIRQAKTGILDLFLRRFAEHQAQQGGRLLDWSRHHYQPDQLRREFRAQWWASFITDKILRRE